LVLYPPIRVELADINVLAVHTNEGSKTACHEKNPSSWILIAYRTVKRVMFATKALTPAMRRVILTACESHIKNNDVIIAR
jgi:hypothetical protein